MQKKQQQQKYTSEEIELHIAGDNFGVSEDVNF